MTQNNPNQPPPQYPQQYPPAPGYPQQPYPPPGYPPAGAPYGAPPMMGMPPPPAKRRWPAIVGIIVAIVVVLVGALAWIGNKYSLGTQYKATSKESVYYSGNATEAEAKQLGDELKKMSYFDDAKVRDVLLKKDEEGTTIRFVVGEGWDKPEVLASFTAMAHELAKTFGKPFKVKLVDDERKDLKDVLSE